MEILKNGESIWKGSVHRGCGNNVFDYSTTIVLEEFTASDESQSNVTRNSPPSNEKLFEFGSGGTSNSKDSSKDSSRDSSNGSSARSSPDFESVATETEQGMGSNLSFSKPVKLGNISARRMGSASRLITEDEQKNVVEKQQTRPVANNVLIEAYMKTRPDNVPIWLGEASSEQKVETQQIGSRPSSSRSRPGLDYNDDSKTEYTNEDLLRDLDRETSGTVTRPSNSRRSRRPTSVENEEKYDLGPVATRLNSGETSRPGSRPSSRPGSGTSTGSASGRLPRSRSDSSPKTQPSMDFEPEEVEKKPLLPSKEDVVPRARSIMDESFDSLMHFKTHHKGMLKGRDSDDEEDHDDTDSDEEYQVCFCRFTKLMIV
jgi:hypothetical protein